MCINSCVLGKDVPPPPKNRGEVNYLLSTRSSPLNSKFYSIQDRELFFRSGTQNFRLASRAAPRNSIISNSNVNNTVVWWLIRLTEPQDPLKTCMTLSIFSNMRENGSVPNTYYHQYEYFAFLYRSVTVCPNRNHLFILNTYLDLSLLITCDRVSRRHRVKSSISFIIFPATSEHTYFINQNYLWSWYVLKYTWTLHNVNIVNKS